MIINSKTIIVGAGAIIVVYLFFKSEASQAVEDVKNKVKDVYEPVRKASSGVGSWFYDLTHPNSYTARLRRGEITEGPISPTVNDVRR